ncbi:MAG: FtsQ-type POTRA domain-containing protein [Nitriliruptor sp.]|nr:MAG: FtsQ-type POTRA domain-containing protein [Nitriliruptor sp.]
MIDDRIAARRQEVRDDRRHRRLRRTVMLVTVLAVAILVVLIERSPLVGLEEVQVTGIDRLTDAQVRDAADIPLGTSTLRLGLGQAVDRVTDLPLVREAQASRIDPLSVVIEVVERQPVLVADDGERQMLIDRDGVVIAEGDLDGLPRVRIDGSVPAAGDTVRDHPALHNAHRAWEGLSGPLRARVERYDAAAPDDLALVLEDGIEVRFGRAERVAEKVRALGAVLEDVGSTPITRIDVRAPGAPVVVAE